MVYSERKGRGRNLHVQTVHSADVCGSLFQTISHQGGPTEIPIDTVHLCESHYWKRVFISHIVTTLE